MTAQVLAQQEERELVVMAEDRVLTIWSVLEEMSGEFEVAHPGVRVKRVDTAGAIGSRDKVKFMLAGGMPLDVIRLDVTELAAYWAESALLPLDAWFENDPTFVASDYYENILDGLRDADGRIYGLPSTFTPYVFYVNLDLLEASAPEWNGELPTEWSWQDLLRICQRATVDADGDGRTDVFGISLTQWLQAVTPWIWQSGGGLLTDDGRSGFNLPETRRALSFLRDLLHTYKVASFDASHENQLSQGLFQAGKTVFYGPVGYWETYRFRSIDAFRWDVMPLPGDEARATAVAMQAYVVPRTARHPELAYEFIRMLGGQRYQEALAIIGNGVPGLKTAARSESFLRPDAPPAHAQTFLDVLETARLMPVLSNWRKVEALCQSELEGILLLGNEVDPACDRMAALTDRYLDREARRHDLPPMPLGLSHRTWWVLVPLATLLGVVLVRARRRGGESVDRGAYLLLAPWLAGVLLFGVGPAITSVVLSLAEWSPLRDPSDMRWVAGENYQRMAADPTFLASLNATLLYALLSVPIGLCLALALALLVRRKGVINQGMRVVLYLPAIVSPVIIAALFRFLFDDERGPIAAVTWAIGVPPILWLKSPELVVPAYVLMSLWTVGSQMLVFLAGLAAIDESRNEAAIIDGASALRRLWHVTVPALAPVILFNLIVGTVSALQIFAQAFVMTQGGPGDASRFLVLYLYESGFVHLDMGYASAIAWVIVLIAAILTAVFVRASRRFVHYAGGSR